MELTKEGYPARNRQNGRFLKGHIPHNAGKPWSEWMDGRKAKRVKRIAAQNLRPRMDIGGWNKRAVVAVKDGKHWYCESARKAGELLHLQSRNITNCCQKKRKHCGGYMWFYYEDDEWIKLVKR